MRKFLPLLALLGLFAWGCASSDAGDETNSADSTASEAPQPAPEPETPASFDDFVALYPDLTLPFKIEKTQIDEYVQNLESKKFSKAARDSFLAGAIEPWEDESGTVFAPYGKVLLKSGLYLLLTFHNHEGNSVVVSTFKSEGEFLKSKNVFKVLEDPQASRLTVNFADSHWGKFSVFTKYPADFNSMGEPISFTSSTDHWKVYGNGGFGPDDLSK